MIIWINGSFGVGKTTVSKELNEQIENSIIYDPENIGTFLKDNMPYKKDDFQDYALWRNLNYEILNHLSSKYNQIIVPMTISNISYYDEIIGKLRNDNIEVRDYILIASKDNLIKRLDKRGNSTEWSYNQIDRCINSFNNMKAEIKKINTDNKSVKDIVLEILDDLKR